MTRSSDRTAPGGTLSFLPLGVVFFLSGVPALLYQLCWQRMLFTVYGVNIESITVVVSAFMLGLGLGSLGGGRLARQARLSPLLLFCGLEFAIAAFGLASPWLFSWVGDVTLGASLLATAVLSFLLVVLPTMMMGASLPLLVAHLLKSTRNMGRAVGLLYFVNTLGSAGACFLAAWWSFGALGLSGTLLLAAGLNAVVAVGAFAVHWTTTQRPSPPTPSTEKETAPVSAKDRADASDTSSPPPSLISFRLVLALSAAAGFVSLSYEIVLSRAFSFVAQGRASAFPLLLGWYLVGIAGGSLGSGIYCARSTATRAAQLRTVGLFFLFVNVFGYLTIPLMSRWVQSIPFEQTYPLAALLSGGLGATLPLVTHVGIAPDAQAAERLSFVYVANIVGSTAGSLLTGFWAMDFLSLDEMVALLAIIGTSLAFVLLFKGLDRTRILALSIAAGAILAGMLVFREEAFDRVYERFLWKETFSEEKAPFRHVVENRSGVVTVTRGGMVFGGGIYDGQLSTDLVYDRNSIVRPYIVSAFHESPRHVLVIGLATGAWTQVLLANPSVEKVTAVEINPGYLDVIAKSESVRSLLSNPKIEIIFDDGRRWLAHHPKKKFDLIVMNTTYHWHAYAANLLSREFLGELKDHLNQTGLAIYNTTSSPEAQRTGAVVFPHALRFLNNMYVSPSPLVPSEERLRRTLAGYEIDGKPVFDLTDDHHKRRFEHVIRLLSTFTTPPELEGFEKRADILARTASARIITDDNMGTEWTFEKN